MRGLIQRVSQAAVVVDGETVGAIERGVLLLLGIENGDGARQVGKLVNKVLNYRIFPDAQGRMNASVKDIDGGVLVVSQFTLAADTKKGLRPSFTPAAPPQDAENLYQFFLAELAASHGAVASGIFGADMQVSLTNDGPVTFLLEV
ncbi:MAG TPA: D-tyrosyl-tRNA(Tyr) deacylase [Porticoccaceae bacterium]|nr:D-tyrosyl-tRNA(Tyr) deacylase [Porticoccaceae bacterium]